MLPDDPVSDWFETRRFKHYRLYISLFFPRFASEQLHCRLSWHWWNTPGCVCLQSERLSAECVGAASAGCWGLTLCLRLRSQWLSPSCSARESVPGWPGRRVAEESTSEASATLTLLPASVAAAPPSAACRCVKKKEGQGCFFPKCFLDKARFTKTATK